ncbi:MAG: NADPH-dependent glutamate synthase [Bacteroidales bacterium]|nr:NADPH-dependent glutamate synthase [Bacteroidales bacterium]
MANKIDRVPVREQDPKVRATNFEEVCYGYNVEEAQLEASRCLNCKKPRCVEACPVGIKIPAFIHQVLEGDFKGAYNTIAEDSSLPAICGRVCPQETQCEGSCILGVKGQPVSIGKLERFVADYNLGAKEATEGNVLGVTDAAEGSVHSTKVAVVGSGPAGLACASDLAKLGYSVTIFESLHKPGGVLTYGIPEFRLPKKAVVEKELQKLLNMGIKIETDVFVGRTVTIDELMDKEGFKAVFVGTGAGLPLFLGIPGENLNGVFSANEYLTRNNLMQAFSKESDTPIFRARKVCVVGGGNVAMDAARTALRLGAEVTIVYRRSEKELPARAEEVHHAKEEGINFQLLTNPVEVLGDENGWVRGIRCIRMELGEPDESGRRSPVPIQGSEFDIEADALIVALGTKINRLIADTTPGLGTDRKGRLLTTETATTRKGVFAGGDVVTGAATVILAMGEGRKAAAAIHSYLSGYGAL